MYMHAFSSRRHPQLIGFCWCLKSTMKMILHIYMYMYKYIHWEKPVFTPLITLFSGSSTLFHSAPAPDLNDD